MQRKNNLLLLAVLACAFSCKKDAGNQSSPDEIRDPIVLSEEEIASIAYDKPRELTEAEIMEVLKDFPLEKDPAVKGGNAAASFSIGEKVYLDQDGSVLTSSQAVKTKGGTSTFVPLYNVSVLNGKRRGKAVVCADERIPVVIAYLPDDTSRAPVSSERTLMYQYSLNMVLNKIDYVKHLKDSLRTATLQKIETVTGKLPEDNAFAEVKKRIRLKSAPGTKSGVNYSLPTRVINQIGPFTTVRWEQDGFGEVYNSRMPTIPCNGGDTRVPAGCGVVAAAQILAHFEPPMTVTRDDNRPFSIDWGYLKQTPSISMFDENAKLEMIGCLMKHVYYGCQASPSCHDTGPSTGTSTPNTEAYLRQFINIDNSRNFDVPTCKTSLDNLRLVMCSGSRSTGTEKIAHAWVVDGYAICQKGPVNGNNGSNDIVNRFDMYLHANVGYGEFNETGWFLVGNNWQLSFTLYAGTSYQRDYNIDLKCSPNARRK